MTLPATPTTGYATPHTGTPAAYPGQAPDAAAHLRPELWEQAERLLIRKALAEFAHERLLTPEALPDEVLPDEVLPDEADVPAGRPAASYRVLSDDSSVAYRFRARVTALDHWRVDAASVVRSRVADGRELPLSALDFFTEFRESLGISRSMLPVYLEEISSTLASTCFKLSRPRPSSAELAHADFQAVETSMTEGHPCFVANNGRLGFGVHEYRAYAPETGNPVRLLWLAAHRDRTTFTAGQGLDYETLMTAELGEATRSRFDGQLRELGLDPDDYLLIPVHPWQWWNKLTVTFAAEIARQRVVCLGEGEDAHLAQQSIRTFFNVSDPSKHYVKTALSVINMGFMRGLSAAYMEATPAINDWLQEVVTTDPVLKATGLSLIRERAAVGYRHLEYEAATDRYSPYRKMLAALWRESPVPQLTEGESLATMASLLHTDDEGHSLAAAYIARSGLTPGEWLRRYLHAYLTPLLHSFYKYGLVYMPHGENVILVLEDGAVQRAVFKDLAEEIAVMNPDTELPPGVDRVKVDVPEEMQLLSLFTDVFDCFFRFLASDLDAEDVVTEDGFWSAVAECIRDYQASAPELGERFAKFDLFSEEFALSCLNRLQLRNNEQMVDLADPAGALQLIGTLRNPLAGRGEG